MEYSEYRYELVGVILRSHEEEFGEQYATLLKNAGSHDWTLREGDRINKYEQDVSLDFGCRYAVLLYRQAHKTQDQ